MKSLLWKNKKMSKILATMLYGPAKLDRKKLVVTKSIKTTNDFLGLIAICQFYNFYLRFDLVNYGISMWLLIGIQKKQVCFVNWALMIYFHGTQNFPLLFRNIYRGFFPVANISTSFCALSCSNSGWRDV